MSTGASEHHRATRVTAMTLHSRPKPRHHILPYTDPWYMNHFYKAFQSTETNSQTLVMMFPGPKGWGSPMWEPTLGNLESNSSSYKLTQGNNGRLWYVCIGSILI